jgi:inositol hexakisphosphate/diphosphoinositol-pentakisphosphate kinase
LIKLRELEATVSKKEAILRKLRGAGTFPWRSPIVVGVCAMEKKAKCKPMRAILGRLPHDEFEIKIFEEKVILEDPIECWPVCDCLIAFYSTGFPQAKVEAYVNLRKPFLVNDLESQRLLWDRRNVYKICALNDIPVPNHIIVDRDKDIPDEIIEGDDYIEVNGKRLNKPFVEKPVDAE